MMPRTLPIPMYMVPLPQIVPLWMPPAERGQTWMPAGRPGR